MGRRMMAAPSKDARSLAKDLCRRYLPARRRDEALAWLAEPGRSARDVAGLIDRFRALERARAAKEDSNV